MKIEAILWTGVAVFYIVIGLLYLAVGGDTAGVVLLLLATGLGGLVAGWVWDWTRRNGERVENRADVDAIDSTGVVGVYPTASLRPLALAIGVTAMFLGIPLGSWLSMVGIAIVASQVLLLTRDTDT
ncbi:aa3-type cytochrome oxidase subunit IV [Ilumatobacter nonamiensis]|uniref:aa3-type cytochrome oxidase subunit IV n=1 Tax=Ilumatobacter nonamiensis TaxID=467093 RepID=UPI00034DABF0|nr:cytochrome c oxidase subunit 4 [Ilumatobacter nonamiensis]